MERVATAIRQVSSVAIEPRFAQLLDGDVEEKTPGEVVTVADREAEALLEEHLGSILPGVPMVGEEICSVDPLRMAALTAKRAWLVDPLDGTANFVAGSTDWGVMVALLAEGVTTASWLWQPITRHMYVAGRGEGAYRDGVRLRSAPRPSTEAELHGAVLSRFLDPDTSTAIDRNRRRFASISDGRRCAAVEYPALIEGDEDFVLFWRTLPWDHAPGALLVQEAGGVACRPNGAPYSPSSNEVGLLVAADPPTWALAGQVLA